MQRLCDVLSRNRFCPFQAVMSRTDLRLGSAAVEGPDRPSYFQAFVSNHLYDIYRFATSLVIVSRIEVLSLAACSLDVVTRIMMVMTMCIEQQPCPRRVLGQVRY